VTQQCSQHCSHITLIPIDIHLLRGYVNFSSNIFLKSLCHRPTLALRRLGALTHHVYFWSALNSSHWDWGVTAITSTASLNGLNVASNNNKKKIWNTLQELLDYLYNTCQKDDKPNEVNYSTPYWKLYEKWSKSHTSKSCVLYSSI